MVVRIEQLLTPPLEPRDFHPITSEEISRALKSTSNSSAPGLSQISYKFIKYSFPYISSFLLSLFNSLFLFSYHPLLWKSALVVVIPKPRKADYSSPRSYHPISLLECFSKLLEKIIANRISYDSILHAIIPANQFGGKPFSSTADAGVSLMSHINKIKKKHPTHHFSLITMDIKGFFDSLSHSRIIHLLYLFGFPSKICKWLTSFLSNRSISFKINNSTSSPLSLSSIGIPQGSPLSPILSVIYTSLTIRAFNIPNAIPFSYIDDIAILCHYPHYQDAHKTICNSFYFFKDQLRVQGLLLDLSKTKLVHFGKKFSKSHTPSHTITVLDYDNRAFNINSKFTIRWLGFHFTRTLSFKLHVNFMAQKALSAFFALRMFLSSIGGLSPHHLRHIYVSCVVPILFYGFQLWYNPSSPSRLLLSILQKTQNKCLVKIAGAFKTSTTHFLHNFLAIPPITIVL